jgi:hypothetical protein
LAEATPASTRNGATPTRRGQLPFAVPELALHVLPGVRSHPWTRALDHVIVALHHESFDEAHSGEVPHSVVGGWLDGRRHERLDCLYESLCGRVVAGAHAVHEPAQEVALEHDVGQQLLVVGQVLVQERAKLWHSVDEPCDGLRLARRTLYRRHDVGICRTTGLCSRSAAAVVDGDVPERGSGYAPGGVPGFGVPGASASGAGGAAG